MSDMDTIKFNGTFKNLKNIGYQFMKLYAMNYKVYNKKMDGGHKIWIWVANGGNIEIDDLYNCSQLYIDAIKSIDWNEIESSNTFNEKFVNVYYNHGCPEDGFEIKKYSFDFYTSIMYSNEMDKLGLPSSPINTEVYTRCYDSVREKWNSTKSIHQKSSEILLKELLEIQNC
jgi:hypothetical protein